MKPESSSFLSSSFQSPQLSLASPLAPCDALDDKIISRASGTICRPGRVPRPNSRSALRLPPLENEASPIPAMGASHLATIRNMRRSQSFTGSTGLAAPQAGWSRPERGDEQRGKAVETGRASPRHVRNQRRIRRSVDICMEAGRASGSGNSCGGASSPTSPAAVFASSPAERADSALAGAPPEASDSSMASNEDATRSKARAVAMLQKLFFEELANGSGQDANSAAVAALRRLTEGSLATRPSTAMSSPVSSKIHEDTQEPLHTPAEAALPRKPLMAAGDGPRRPAPMVGRPGQKVKVQS